MSQEKQAAKVGSVDLEDHPDFEGFIRAFWRRIEPYKNDYGKELPKEMPVEFRCHMGTALSIFRKYEQ